MKFSNALGSAEQAPIYEPDSGLSYAWSGLSADEFNDKLVEELRSFIIVNAEAHGCMDAKNDNLGHRLMFFHPDFLGGWPHELWSEYYFLGAKRAFESEAITIH